MFLIFTQRDPVPVGLSMIATFTYTRGCTTPRAFEGDGCLLRIRAAEDRRFRHGVMNTTESNMQGYRYPQNMLDYSMIAHLITVLGQSF